VAVGRAALHDAPDDDIRRMLVLSEQLEESGHVELEHGLV
jgi:hypothetical protein